MCWYGADPGGTNCFGVAALRDNGTFQTWCVSSVDEALRYISKPSAIGIDCPLWWSSGPGGWRRADRRLINACGREGILAVNSLRGAVLVQGVVLAVRLREMDRNIGLSETHPKALLRALNLSRWVDIAAHFSLHGDEPENEHRRDALLGAVVVREAARGNWTTDLAQDRDSNEIDPKDVPFGPVAYWWPH